jgi:hypothetical protein
MGEIRNAYRIFLGISPRKVLLDRPRRRWEEHIKIYLKQMAFEGLHWIQMAPGSPVLN